MKTDSSANVNTEFHVKAHLQPNSNIMAFRRYRRPGFDCIVKTLCFQVLTQARYYFNNYIIAYMYAYGVT